MSAEIRRVSNGQFAVINRFGQMLGLCDSHEEAERLLEYQEIDLRG